MDTVDADYSLIETSDPNAQNSSSMNSMDNAIVKSRYSELMSILSFRKNKNSNPTIWPIYKLIIYAHVATIMSTVFLVGQMIYIKTTSSDGHLYTSHLQMRINGVAIIISQLIKYYIVRHFIHNGIIGLSFKKIYLRTLYFTISVSVICLVFFIPLGYYYECKKTQNAEKFIALISPSYLGWASFGMERLELLFIFFFIYIGQIVARLKKILTVFRTFLYFIINIALSIAFSVLWYKYYEAIRPIHLLLLKEALFKNATAVTEQP
ncbi:hypothetical protein NEAUS06_0501 [Nematocida ausubeli]|nr:hypothetical protein NEAUS06_0501 [Nematocida ausubeli]